jgi:hypothetical protein
MIIAEVVGANGAVCCWDRRRPRLAVLAKRISDSTGAGGDACGPSSRALYSSGIVDLVILHCAAVSYVSKQMETRFPNANLNRHRLR